MYDTSDIRKGLKVLLDGNPYTVVEFQFIKPGKGAAFTRTRFKNLLSGAVIERNIRSGEKLEPANVEERTMQYLYKEADDLVFMDDKSFEQVQVRAEMIGEAADLMKVTASEPGVAGNTAAGNVTKAATVETGGSVQVPLFINIGDMIKIDTRTHEYVERVNKK